MCRDEQLDAKLRWKRLTPSMTVTLLAHFGWRSNLPVVLRRERDDCDEPDVVVLAPNGNSQAGCVLNHADRYFGEAKRNCGLRHFLPDVVSREANHRVGVQAIGSPKNDRAEKLRVR